MALGKCLDKRVPIFKCSAHTGHFARPTSLHASALSAANKVNQLSPIRYVSKELLKADFLVADPGFLPYQLQKSVKIANPGIIHSLPNNQHHHNH